MIFKWSEKLICGNPIIDFQHRFLFKVMDNVKHDIKKGKSIEAAKEMIHFLKVYFIEHFGDEEQIMAETGYPKIREHKTEHRKIRSEAFRMIRLLEKSNYSASRVYDTFLSARDWLQIHLKDYDQELIDYLQKYYDEYHRSKQLK